MSSPDVQYTTYATANGQQATITLADGTIATLSVASRLKVPLDYDKNHHLVELVAGEALFIAPHHAGAPFTVVTGSTTVRVLGTRFVVRHYNTDTSTTVAVSEGKVLVNNVVVMAQHLAEIGPSQVPALRLMDPSQFSFSSGVLTLNDIPLSRAIVELDRWYDADIRLSSPSLAPLVFHGRFVSGSIAELSEILALTFDVRVKRVGRVLTLYPKTS